MKKSTSQLYLHGTRSGAKAPLARRYDSKFKPGAAYREAMPDLMDAEDTLLGAPVVIPQVGVSNFRLPLRYKAAGGRILDLETSVTGTVSVDASQKGINMSRILRSFYARGGAVFSLEALEKILSAYRKEVGALEARVKLAISYPILQHALRSGLEGYQYYAVSLEGSLDREGRFRRFMEFDFVYSSACPCSAELSEHARAVRGAYAVPHSQRSRARVRVEVASGTKLRIEDLQKHCLAALKTETQVMVKREDEQAFAELNGTELKFVEDALRLLYGQLASDKRIADFRVVCSHQESLHSHDAVGAIAKGVRGGMNAECMDFQSLA